MELDEETLEELGFGSPRYLLLVAAGVSRRREQIRRAWNTYATSSKGKEATKRRDEKRRESDYFERYYAANAERIKARVKKWREEKKKKDPEWLKRRRAQQNAAYAKRKTR